MTETDLIILNFLADSITDKPEPFRLFCFSSKALIKGQKHMLTVD